MPLMIEWTLDTTTFCGIFRNREYFLKVQKEECALRHLTSRVVSEKEITQEEFDRLRSLL